MAPNLVSVMPTGVLYEGNTPLTEPEKINAEKKEEKRPLKIVWRNAILFAYLHVAAIYGFYLAITSAKLYTNLFGRLRSVFKYFSLFFFN